MTVVWHRLCFDPRPTRERFANSTEFGKWVAKYFSDFEYSLAGYIGKQWDHGINSMGTPYWNIIIPGHTSYSNYQPCIIRHLANNHWAIDDFDVLLYTKYAEGDGNEVLYPIRAGHVDG